MESFTFSGGRVDRSGPYPVVRGALICGLKSKWGYDYPPEVFDATALKAYENAPSYMGHGRPGEARDPATKLGWWENPRKRANGEPEGDYAVNPKHPHAEAFLWAAEHKPDFYSMSHVADVDYGHVGGRKVVKRIKAVESVDVVSSGGTMGSIYEHAPPEGSAMPTVKEYADKLGRRCTVAQLLKLKTLVQEDDYGAAPMMPDAPDAESGETEPEDGIDSAFLAVAMKEIQECMDAKGDPAKLKKCLGRLKKILMTHGELTGDEGDEDEEDEDEDEDEDEGGKPAAESAPGTGSKGKGTGKKNKKPVARESAPAGPDLATVLTECDAEQFTPSPVVREALLGIPTADRRKQFIREQKGLARASSPRSAGREAVARESAGGDQPTEAEKVRLKMRQLAAENQGAKPPAK